MITMGCNTQHRTPPHKLHLTGADVATQSAGITLVKGDLRGIAKAIRLGRATMRNIRQNLLFAFLYNVGNHPMELVWNRGYFSINRSAEDSFPTKRRLHFTINKRKITS
jgi:hypothetical protein